MDYHAIITVYKFIQAASEGTPSRATEGGLRRDGRRGPFAPIELYSSFHLSVVSFEDMDVLHFRQPSGKHIYGRAITLTSKVFSNCMIAKLSYNIVYTHLHFNNAPTHNKIFIATVKKRKKVIVSKFKTF
jgi:hypothetical protein